MASTSENDDIVISLSSKSDVLKNVQILDMSTGKILADYNELRSNDQLDICQLGTGTYLVRYVYNEISNSLKFIKQ